MALTVEMLAAEAMNLQVAERARLVDRLIASLDSDPEIEAVWLKEVERRSAEMESGSVKPLDSAEVFARLKADCE